jgi:uncharacterized cupin superfamily protein
MEWQPIPEARLEQSEQDELVPASAGWFVVNVADARGLTTDDLGSAALFEGNHEQGVGFEEFGLNVQVLDPGQPNCMYHRENQQEGYLVLFGECLLIVEEQERRMRQWDYAHLPSGTAHVCVGAGNGPCAVLMVGTRRGEDEEILYPVSETAARHGASVEVETPSPEEAYARFSEGSRRRLPWPPS